VGDLIAVVLVRFAHWVETMAIKIARLEGKPGELH
jgi:hypothetical protein